MRKSSKSQCKAGVSSCDKPGPAFLITPIISIIVDCLCLFVAIYIHPQNILWRVLITNYISANNFKNYMISQSSPVFFGSVVKDVIVNNLFQ